MWTLIRNGGVVPMTFILVFGMAGLLAAFAFAIRAERRIWGFLKTISAAVLFATCSASCADVGATLYNVSDVYEKGEPYKFRDQPVNPHAMVIQGLAESTSPGIMGFSFLAVIAMLAAVGRRRLDDKADAR
ncbi:MAG: hypothetical protein JST00_24530 [Deltaproteobacteria bacterium]|nr:hypothetical protein [Deltaproteobacteria bacterium]